MGNREFFRPLCRAELWDCPTGSPLEDSLALFNLNQPTTMSSEQKRALVIAFDGIEEIEALTPVDLLRRAKVEVIVASVDGQPTVTGRNAITFAADTALALVEGQAFDLIVLPGGPGVLEHLENQTLQRILQAQDAAGGEIGAICAAPKALTHFGLLEGRQATAHQSVRSELPHPSDDRVVIAGNITTSQGAGTAIEFSLTLIKKLKGESTANEVANSIHY